MRYLLDTNAWIGFLTGRAPGVFNGLTLVTHNVREFERVAGLRIEDWGSSA